MPFVRSASRWSLLVLALAAGSAARAEALRWVAIGDTGSNCSFVQPDSSRESWVAGARAGRQTMVAEHLAEIVRELDVRELFFLGDNFYPRGLEGGPLGEACLELAFTDLYSHLLPPGRLHVLPGNHDYDVAGSFERQLALSGKVWTYHARPELLQLVPGLIDVVPFDSAILVLDPEVRPEYRRLLTAALRESRAPWLLVMAHHPLHTIGKHNYRTFYGRLDPDDYGSAANRAYRQLVRDAIVAGGRPVRLFLAGHDHSLQFLQVEQSAPELPEHHVVSGAGGKLSLVHSLGETRWGAAVPGFAVLEIDTRRPNVLAVRFFDSARKLELRTFQIRIDPFPFEWTEEAADAAGAPAASGTGVQQ